MHSKSMKAILVDDDENAIKVLSSLLAAYDDVKIVGSYTKPEAALAEIAKVKPDVIFLDIEMGYIDGLTMADLFNQQHFVDIIFVTAYAQYAVQAFDVNAIDYLLKPVQKKRLDQAIERLKVARKARVINHSAIETKSQFLSIVSFDHMEVLNQDGKAMVWRTKKARELFYFLWLSDDRQANKSVIIEKLFPERDEDKALALLHTTVYQLRRGLADLGFAESITFAHNKYRLASTLNSDLDRLQSILESGLKDDLDLLEITQHYRRDFLAEEEYDWADAMQLQLKNQVFFAVTEYIRRKLHEGYISFPEESLDFLRRISPCDESTALLIVHILGRQKRQYELVRYFNDYKKQLAKEMKANPSETIVSAFDRYMEE